MSLVESKPKPLDTLTIGFAYNYAHQPFEFGNSAGNVRVLGIVDQLHTFDFNVSYSFSDRMALGIGIPVHVTKNITSFTNIAKETPMNLGDIMLTGIYNFIQPETNKLNIGFSVMPFFSFPSGNGSDFIGDAHVTAGFLLIGDIQQGRHYGGLNLGFRFRETESFLNLDIASELLYTAAYHINIIPDYAFDGFVELNGSTVLKDFFKDELQSPVEMRLGVNKGFLQDNVLKAKIFAGVGLGSGYGNPDVRVGFHVSYDHLLPRTREVIKIVESKIQKIEKELKELTIYYPTDGAKVDPFYDVKIAAIAQILKENPSLGPLYIIGHTDDVGSNAYNQRLSEKRAQQSAASIIAQGLDPKNIVWVGLGEDFPVVENSSDANRALNRRTLFTFIKPDQLIEKLTKRGVMGINTITGKKNDSYTEVLKELDSQKQIVNEDGKAVVVKKYKDKSEVTLEDDGTTVTKDTPTSYPKQIKNKPRTKKVYEEGPAEVTVTTTTKKALKKEQKKDRKKEKAVDKQKVNKQEQKPTEKVSNDEKEMFEDF